MQFLGIKSKILEVKTTTVNNKEVTFTRKEGLHFKTLNSFLENLF